MNVPTPSAARYAAAIGVTMLALYLRYLLTPLLGGHSPYHTVWLAVIFCSWYLGVGPSVVCSLLSALGITYFFLQPIHSLVIQDRAERYGILWFLIFSGAIIALGESNRRGASSRSLLATIVDSSDDAIISKTFDGIITSWNSAAERMFGYTAKQAIGSSIDIIVPAELRQQEQAILERLRSGEPIHHLETVRCTNTGEKVDVSLTISLVKGKGLNRGYVGASGIIHDISERKHAEVRLKAANDQLEARVAERTGELQQKNAALIRQAATVRELSARLLQLQDDERRRIARELHDSVGQLLAAININTSRVAREKASLSPGAVRGVEENLVLVEQVLTEIRTMSHLLHPPLLDEIGLESAIRWFIQGFTQRSKIEVTLNIEPEFERLSAELEIALFRVIQECLTNVHRHSGGGKAEIQLARKETYVYLEVRDDGHGIPAEKQLDLNSPGTLGVGFRGMRERLNQLGGELRVNSSANGTRVSATLPVDRAPAKAFTSVA
jgi:PAS domain S-box-containing protein